MKKSIYVAPANAQWTKSILNEFLTIDRLDKNSNSDKFLGYEKIKIMFIDRKLHEKYNVKLEDLLSGLIPITIYNHCIDSIKAIIVLKLSI